jgi:hypothetical protein
MKLLPIVFAALVAAAPAAVAQPLDLAALKCKDFLARGAEDNARILMWLEGYYSEENAVPTLDLDKFKADGDKLADYCQKYNSASVIQAAEAVFGK